MEEDLKNEILYVSYGKLWSVLESQFNLNSVDITDIIIRQMAEHFNLKGLTPIGVGDCEHVRWSNIFIKSKMNGKST